MMIDKIYMDRCLQLAEKGKGSVSPNPMVGCVIVKDAKIIAEGYHHKFGEKHAEIDALDKIAGKAKGATLYVNLEPCSHKGKTPPCVDRIIKEKISKVIIGSIDTNPLVNKQGIEKLRDCGIDVVYGILNDKCLELNEMFFYNIESKKPFVFLKIALSQNLFMTDKDKTQIKITNEYSDKITHKWRSEYDGVMVGTGTVIADDPSLTVRNVSGKNPYRIILDRNKKLDLSKYRIFNDEYKNFTLVVSDKNITNKNYTEELKNKKIKLIELESNSTNKPVDLESILKELLKNGISSLMIEGGVKLAKEVLDKKLAQKLSIFIGRNEIQNGLSPFKARNINDLQKELGMKNPEVKNIVGDTLIENIF